MEFIDKEIIKAHLKDEIENENEFHRECAKFELNELNEKEKNET